MVTVQGHDSPECSIYCNSQFLTIRSWLESFNALGKGIDLEKDERNQLHTSLALLPVDKGQIPYLYSRLLEAKPNEADVLVKSLGSYKEELVEQLWNVLLKPEKAKEMQVLRAASALAAYDGGVDRENWEKISPLIVNQLVKENSLWACPACAL